MGEKSSWRCNSSTAYQHHGILHRTFFALRSGAEHRHLRFKPSQIELFEPDNERAYLRYTEDVSKSNQGGLAYTLSVIKLCNSPILENATRKSSPL